MSFTRRSFLKNSLAASCALPLVSVSGFGESLMTNKQLGGTPITDKLNVSIFSKHLQFLDYKETGQMAAELGFDGVDLTVRPKGHVLPEQVTEDLPRAIREIRVGGSTCKMITTSIESVDNPLDVTIIETAAKSEIEYYRTNWYKYPDGVPMSQALDGYRDQVTALGELNAKHNIVGCYQNHAGTKVGASYWEIFKLLETVDPKFFGTQYDIRHATVDGGLSWTNGLELLRESIKVIVLKDFTWGKVGNEWKVVNVPIGEGMVDFDKYFKLLKGYGMNPPVSLHLEYPLGGAEKGKFEIEVDREVVYDAMRIDLKAVQQLWKEA